MARRRLVREPRILFPWEGRSGLFRALRLSRARPIVLALLVVGAVVWVGLRERRLAGIRQTRALLLTVREAIDMYMADHGGKCPPSLREVTPYAGWQRIPRDAWGRQLRFVCPSRRRSEVYELMSDGPDGKPGGLDRIE